jgi:hypothetical protein
MALSVLHILLPGDYGGHLVFSEFRHVTIIAILQHQRVNFTSVTPCPTQETEEVIKACFTELCSTHFLWDNVGTTEVNIKNLDDAQVGDAASLHGGSVYQFFSV